jgi:hypothetical protein
MKRFVEGADRGQSTLFPAVLDDYVGEDNPVACPFPSPRFSDSSDKHVANVRCPRPNSFYLFKLQNPFAKRFNNSLGSDPNIDIHLGRT